MDVVEKIAVQKSLVSLSLITQKRGRSEGGCRCHGSDYGGRQGTCIGMNFMVLVAMVALSRSSRKLTESKFHRYRRIVEPVKHSSTDEGMKSQKGSGLEVL